MYYRALKNDILLQDMVNDCDPSLMFAIPRLAIVWLVIILCNCCVAIMNVLIKFVIALCVNLWLVWTPDQLVIVNCSYIVIESVQYGQPQRWFNSFKILLATCSTIERKELEKAGKQRTESIETLFLKPFCLIRKIWLMVLYEWWLALRLQWKNEYLRWLNNAQGHR